MSSLGRRQASALVSVNKFYECDAKVPRHIAQAAAGSSGRAAPVNGYRRAPTVNPGDGILDALGADDPPAGIFEMLPYQRPKGRVPVEENGDGPIGSGSLHSNGDTGPLARAGTNGQGRAQ